MLFHDTPPEHPFFPLNPHRTTHKQRLRHVASLVQQVPAPCLDCTDSIGALLKMKME